MLPDGVALEEAAFGAYQSYIRNYDKAPNARRLGRLGLYLTDLYGVTSPTGGPVGESSPRGFLREFRDRSRRGLEEVG